MNFSTPQKVYQTIRAGDSAEWIRSENRTKITQSANGSPPLSEEEAEKLRVAINVNWGELAVLLTHARRQYYNSFLRGTRYLKVSIPLAPEEFRASWEQFITARLNKILKKSKRLFHLHQYRWTDVVVHGVATVLWEDEDDWCPRFCAREDIRIPTDTETSFHNLEWFAHRPIYTPGELVRKVWGENSDRHWDKKAVASILANYKEVNYDSAMNAYDWNTQAEKMAELVKQNLGYYSSDAVPGIPLWSFYYKDTDGKWYVVVVPDTPTVKGSQSQPDKFLYECDEPVADDIDHLLHCQFGDLNFKTPFMFHSVRSLGFELLEPVFYTNLTRCRLLQHVHENFNPWIQIADPADKARAQAIEFSGPVARIPPGVKILGQNERHQIDANLVEMAMAQLKQLMQESSASYTQQIDTGTKKEQTATETGVKVQQVNAMLAGLMLSAFTMEKFFDEEMCRRFTRKQSLNKDVQKFQKQCQEYGIRPEFMDVEQWEVEPEQPLGAGNPTMEMVQAQQLMGVRPMLNPTAQQEVMHDYLAVMADAKRADRWAPMDNTHKVTDAQAQAQSDFGSLMWGSPVPIRDEFNPIEQIETLLGKMAGVIQSVQQRGNMAETTEVIGLQTVAQHIQELIQRLAQNPQEKQRVTAYQQALGKLMNDVKGFAQRLQEKMQKEAENEKNGNGKGQEAALKAHAMMLASAVKTHLDQKAAANKERLDNMKFAGDERRKNAMAFSKIQREKVEAKAKAKLKPAESE